MTPNDDRQKTTGGCMCGEVRYELVGSSEWTGYCHCESCRKHTGAPVVAYVSFPAERVTWTSGERALYESSPGRFRAFCRNCGTSLTWEVSSGTAWGDREIVEIHISTLDNPNDFSPTEHCLYRERISWFDTNDDLTRYEGAPEL